MYKYMINISDPINDSNALQEKYRNVRYILPMIQINTFF